MHTQDSISASGAPVHLVVVIPCLNEAATIAGVITAVPREIPGIASVAVVVVDDGSSDDTASLARRAGARVVSHTMNMGVGAAFQTGIDAALRLGADVIVNMDGDGQFDPGDIPRLVAPILEGRADFVTASRFKDPAFEPAMPRVKRLGNRLMSALVSSLVRIRFSDVSCGFRAYSQDAALTLNLTGRFTYTQESFIELALKGKAILEVPVEVKGVREFGKSRVADNLWVYGYNTLKIILRAYRDYKPLRFFGGLGLFFIILALGFGIFFAGHYLATGRFSPHIWAGFTTGFCLLLGVVFGITGLVADMLDRIRANQEKILLLAKRQILLNSKPPEEG